MDRLDLKGGDESGIGLTWIKLKLVKAGPFNPKQAKELDPWAPSENGIAVATYYDMLSELCREKMRNI